MAASVGELKHKTEAIADADAAYAQPPLAKLTPKLNAKLLGKAAR